jgi:long-chain fatty acid transport protein
MPSREASTEVDAVYFNPAGLTSMKHDGWSISVNNQALRQNSVVTYTAGDSVSTKYPGVASSLIFPSIFASYKKNNYAIWMGFHVVAGAGGASYDDLPSVEDGLSIAGDQVNAGILDRVNSTVLANSGVDPMYGFNYYEYEFVSEGFAFTPGLMAGFSYKINDAISVGAGARYVMNRVVATSTLEEIQVADTREGPYSTPEDYLQNIIDNEPNIGDPLRNTIGTWIPVSQALLADVEVDVTQTAHGFTPILSLNLTFSEKLNASIKYEHRTPMTYRFNIKDGKDGSGIYSEGNDSTSADLPGFLQLGVAYKWNDRFKTHGGFRYLFDKKVDWNGREDFINKNYFEIAAALEVMVGKKYKGSVSTGYTFNRPGVDPEYQNEVDFRLPGHTFSIGGSFVFSEYVRLNTGLMFTYFVPMERVEMNQTEFVESFYFEKNAIVFGIGLDMILGKARNGDSIPATDSN